ncbi:histidinol dehydrogenase [Aureitalea marina]|uniref:Histidinol dehydrogenase n=1 Tax=Aureitalea marina TaxID=930804 RepID=A0A2S7KPA8_9FLAO|nr:histidinol dehydrogenase [Aureitalea marina]PQB04440.1 histidinol dehydrogenase [Aureitalea marina]
MKIYIEPNRKKWQDILRRPSQSYDEIEPTVLEIFSEIKQKGDQALLRYTQLFDGVRPKELRVTEDELAEASSNIEPELKQAMQVALENIQAFHQAQKSDPVLMETSPGVSCWQEKRPIEQVGLYIPGGTAPLFSTVLMLAIPARIAGCDRVIICSPPDKEGKIHPAVLYAAKLCGVQEVYKVGGIQAIGAMTFGTESIGAVDKIFGPGNQFVTVAKQVATRFKVAIDMPAGPSELLVYADSTGVPDFIASDLLSQAEHGPDSQVILVCDSEELAKASQDAVCQQLNDLPRKSIAQKAIDNSRIVVLQDKLQALEMINTYGPEHFILVSEEEEFFLQGLKSAGSVFLGNYSPESVGDYASGTNHTLPTNGYARQYSGVNLDSFCKSITFQKLTAEGISSLGPYVETMAQAEGLWGHSKAVSLRLESLKRKSV